MDHFGHGTEEFRGTIPTNDEMSFEDTTNDDPYIDDVIIWSTGANIEEVVANHLANGTRFLDVMDKN